jgi:seryl-tRNA synthetase
MMSEQGNFVVALITGGLGAALGSIGTALIQSISKKGEARAVAADRVTNAAGNLADRLDKLNSKLEQENTQMRKAMVALTEAVEDMMFAVEDEQTRKKVQKAINTARIAFR